MSDESGEGFIEKHISFGNILTIVIMLLGGAGVYYANETKIERIDAVQDVRIAAVEAQLARAGLDHDLLIRIDSRLARIEAFAARSSPPGERP